MQTITTIGLDIAKSVFQVHGVDAEGKVIIFFTGRNCLCGLCRNNFRFWHIAPFRTHAQNGR
jgi:transposase